MSFGDFLKGSHEHKGDSPIHAKDIVEGLQKPTFVVWIFITWFSVFGILGLVAPEWLLTVRGFSFSPEFTKEQRAWLCGLAQYHVLHTLLVAALHLIVIREGAGEARLTSRSHMAAVRTLLLTDTVWLSLTCICIWISIVPQMKEFGWLSNLVLGESFLLMGLGFWTFMESRGDEHVWVGGVIKAQTNAANIGSPHLIPRTYGPLAWMIVAGICVPLFLVMPETVLHIYVGDFLKDQSLAMGSLLVQFIGISLLSEVLTLLAIVGSKVIAIQYTAVRILWVWTFAMGIYFCLAQQIHKLMNLPWTPLFACIAVCFVVSTLAKGSMAEFARISAVERTTGRG
mmetsp:Transcript_10671/g.28257  ORF Transcript_10671/g.28257 Transcript_10671/m.28257 type:complete len:341 (-) Transcript_10671:124-1146(-)